jgi:hypothetical protein
MRKFYWLKCMSRLALLQIAQKGANPLPTTLFLGKRVISGDSSPFISIILTFFLTLKLLTVHLET